MRSKIIWLIISCIMVVALVLTSCAEAVEEEEEEGPPEEVPQYGGTITSRAASLNLSFDPYDWSGGGAFFSYFYEPLFRWDWALDREIYSFTTEWTPSDYFVGHLAESWEWPDPQTMIVHIREGVRWQDKPPVNGREFTADDVVYHYDRLKGTGHGYTEPSPYYGPLFTHIEKVTAMDEHTFVYKFAKPAPIYNLWFTLEAVGQMMECPDAVEEYGDLGDWKNAVGTGPWLLTNYVEGSSLTLKKNPNYWDYDERYPDNRLPYADELKVLCIPDMTTALGSLRTGKIDYITVLHWEQAQSLARTDPELKQKANWQASYLLNLRCDKSPFTDVKVRKALQMALDLQTIAETHYGGLVDGIPCGVIHPVYKGYGFAYEGWPEELKGEYSYNPEGAKQLLAEAGYPEGFKTNCVASSVADLDLAQIIKAQLLDINVDMEIRVMEPTAFTSFTRAKEHDQMSMGQTTSCKPPMISIENWMTTFPGNVTNHGDTAYDALVNNFKSTTNLAEAKQALIETDKYYIQSHWAVQTFPIVTYNVWQPYLKGYNGEFLIWGQSTFVTRWWIDQDLK